jgi:hypothetical protein
MENMHSGDTWTNGKGVLRRIKQDWMHKYGHPTVESGEATIPEIIVKTASAKSTSPLYNRVLR